MCPCPLFAPPRRVRTAVKGVKYSYFNLTISKCQYVIFYFPTPFFDKCRENARWNVSNALFEKYRLSRRRHAFDADFVIRTLSALKIMTKISPETEVTVKTFSAVVTVVST